MNSDYNILIIEDEFLLANDIKYNLKSFGWGIAGIAKDHASAVKIMKKEKVDLALIDLKLDGPEDGIITAMELLKMKWVPIIYMTGNTPYEVKRQMKETYPYGFLEKPFRMHELSAQIELALNNFEEGMIANPNRPNTDYVAVPTTDGLFNIKTSEIIYIESVYKKKYTQIFLTDCELQRHKLPSSVPLLASVPFGKLTNKLPRSFFKLKRTKTINLDHIEKIKEGEVFLTSHILTIPENGRKALLEHLNSVER